MSDIESGLMLAFLVGAPVSLIIDAILIKDRARTCRISLAVLGVFTWIEFGYSTLIHRFG